MKHLLNLLAAVALLVWGTHLVRTGVLRVFGANLRKILVQSMRNRFTAALSGIGVTALVQSSTATSLMTSSFVGQGLVTLPAALAVMRGADIGTALMSVLFSADLSWLSPLFIFVGVVLFITRPSSVAGRVGRVLIGLGLMLLALQLVVAATGPLFAGQAMRELLGSLGSDVLLEITIGAALAIVAYSSLAVVLLVAAMASSNVVPLDVAMGLVLGANLGSGLLAVLTTAKSAVAGAAGHGRQPALQAARRRDRGAFRRPLAARGAALHLGRDAVRRALPPGLQRAREPRLHRAHRLGRRRW